MRFYQPSKQFCCGVDLHARNMYICIIDQQKKVVVHQQVLNRDTDILLKILLPYKQNIVVACESSYAWYWLADLCADNGIEFILGHALYMKAINGGKVKNDRIDSQKIALLVLAGLFPLAYVYPRLKRSIRDLLRRRLSFTRSRAKLLSHLHLVNNQANFPELGMISKSRKRRSLPQQRFSDPTIQKALAADLGLIDYYEKIITELEQYILNSARTNYNKELSVLQSIRGVGDIIALTILYEVDNINRFASAQEFASYSRLVRCNHQSAGKIYGSGGKKIGNMYLKYAFSEAAIFVIKFNPHIKKYFNKLESRKGTGKAYAIIAHKIAKCIYFMLKNGTVFDEARFLRPDTKSQLTTGAKVSSTKSPETQNIEQQVHTGS